MIGQFLAGMANAWLKLGMESDARDLGMNSHSFLFQLMSIFKTLTVILEK